jgi:hypothetical protein
MPYFVYAVRPFAQLEQLGAHTSFKDASAQAKALRGATGAESALTYRVMFAEDALAAEDLLLQVRDAGPAGDD